MQNEATHQLVLHEIHTPPVACQSRCWRNTTRFRTLSEDRANSSRRIWFRLTRRISEPLPQTPHPLSCGWRPNGSSGRSGWSPRRRSGWCFQCEPRRSPVAGWRHRWGSLKLQQGLCVYIICFSRQERRWREKNTTKRIRLINLSWLDEHWPFFDFLFLYFAPKNLTYVWLSDFNFFWGKKICTWNICIHTWYVAVHIFAILSLSIKLKLIFIITLNVRFLLSNFCISYHFRKLLKSWMFISYFHRVFGPNFITFPAIFISSLLFFKYFRQILFFPHHVFFFGKLQLEVGNNDKRVKKQFKVKKKNDFMPSFDEDSSRKFL